VYFSQGTLAVSKLLTEPVRNSMIMVLAVGFALIGYGTKAGIAPMHAWLPDAHSPSPVSALFSAVLLPDVHIRICEDIHSITGFTYSV
jgi:formate hydrogenlyase subunit 3/multisubunit Na+/H+ antiporter MnhD subunit